MNFKNENLKEEFWKLQPKLQLIVCDVNDWGIRHGEHPTWTCFLRTEEEQAALVANGQAKDKVSVHQFGRGADFRVFESSSLNFLIGLYLEEKYPYGDGVHKTHLLHNGTAMHHHIQVMA